MLSGRIHRLSSSTSGLVARFFTLYSFSGRVGPALSAGYSSSSAFLQQYKESRKVSVHVFWDFKSCNLPAGANAFKVAQAITTAVRNSGIRGPIMISAFGDLYKLSKSDERAFSSTGMFMNYVPQARMTSDGLVRWVSTIRPPAHIFLISSDRVFASALERLRSDKYNILLAAKTNALDDLSGAATIMWDWCSLVEGKNVTGIQLNTPPHCENYSSYGLIPLQDPFAAVEESNFVKTKESRASSSNLNSEEYLVSSSSGSVGSSSSAGYSSLRCFQQGEESRKVGAFVWWDFMDCNLLAGTDGLKLVRGITAAIRSSGIEGPIRVTAVGDVSRLSKNDLTALSSVGINFNRLSGARDVAIAIITWTIGNPPPAHIFVISSDRGIASTLNRLRMRNYNILLASKAYAPCALLSAATIMWDWHALVKGEHVTGRHFNQPPDGLWYGYYRIPLQDPFAAVEQSNSVETKQSRASNSNLNSEESNALTAA